MVGGGYVLLTFVRNHHQELVRRVTFSTFGTHLTVHPCLGLHHARKKKVLAPRSSKRIKLPSVLQSKSSSKLIYFQACTLKYLMRKISFLLASVQKKDPWHIRLGPKRDLHPDLSFSPEPEELPSRNEPINLKTKTVYPRFILSDSDSSSGESMLLSFFVYSCVFVEHFFSFISCFC